MKRFLLSVVAGALLAAIPAAVWAVTGAPDYSITPSGGAIACDIGPALTGDPRRRDAGRLYPLRRQLRLYASWLIHERRPYLPMVKSVLVARMRGSLDAAAVDHDYGVPINCSDVSAVMDSACNCQVLQMIYQPYGYDRPDIAVH